VEDSQADYLTLFDIDYNWESLERVVGVVFRLATLNLVAAGCGYDSIVEMHQRMIFYSAHLSWKGSFSKAFFQNVF
jgi:hypothetical protein